MAHAAMHLPHEREDLHYDIQHPHRSRVRWWAFVTLAKAKEGKGMRIFRDKLKRISWRINPDVSF